MVELLQEGGIFYLRHVTFSLYIHPSIIPLVSQSLFAGLFNAY